MSAPVIDFYAQSDSEQIAALTVLAASALARWKGQFCEPRLFKYRENAVFAVERDDGIRVALRVHRAAYHSDAALRSELYWMRELDRAGISVPPVMPAADGRLFVHASAADVPETRQVDMIRWLDGTPVERPGPSYYFRLGELAARLHLRGSEIPLPRDFHRHSWDAEGLLGADPVWGRFLDLPALTAEQSGLLRTAAERAARDLAEYGKSAGRFGMIHADLIRDNVLEDGGQLQAIDFDDCGFGWYMFELATILYASLDDPDHAMLRRQLLDGYRAVRPLSGEDIERLPLFMFLRATTYLGWLQTRSETQTAREKGPAHIERCCRVARAYLAGEWQPAHGGEQP